MLQPLPWDGSLILDEAGGSPSFQADAFRIPPENARVALGTHGYA